MLASMQGKSATKKNKAQLKDEQNARRRGKSNDDDDPVVEDEDEQIGFFAGQPQLIQGKMKN